MLTSCPMASFILMLIIISILLDSYVIFRLGLAPKSSVFLVPAFFIIILFTVFTIWLANKTCYNFVWLSWLIAIYIVWIIIQSIILLIDPKKQEELRQQSMAIDKQLAEIRINNQ